MRQRRKRRQGLARPHAATPPDGVGYFGLFHFRSFSFVPFHFVSFEFILLIVVVAGSSTPSLFSVTTVNFSRFSDLSRKLPTQTPLREGGVPRKRAS